MLNVKAFALTAGILWGASVMLTTIWVLVRGGGQHVTMLSQFYIGYDVSVVGSLIGLIYGFVDGFIGGALFAWIYNKLGGAAKASTS